MSPSVCAFGTCTSCTPSPLKYMSFWSWKKVLVGQAPNGSAGAPAALWLIAVSVFSCATMNARPAPAAPQLAQKVAADDLRAGLGDAQVAAGAGRRAGAC